MPTPPLNSGDLAIHKAFNVKRVQTSYIPHHDALSSKVSVGVEVEVENWEGSVPEGWINHVDESLRNSGQEFTIGPMPAYAVPPFIKSLTELAESKNWQDSVRTGIHIHINLSDMMLDFLPVFTAVYLGVERSLFKFAGEWRRWCNFCQSLEESTEPLEAFRGLLTNGGREEAIQLLANSSRYAGLNFQSLSKFGTVEVRILPTTFDYISVIAWLNAVVGIYEVAKDVYNNHNRRVSNYIKVYGTEGFLRNVLAAHPINAAKFLEADALRPALVRAALPQIKWLEFEVESLSSMPKKKEANIVNNMLKEASSSVSLDKDIHSLTHKQIYYALSVAKSVTTAFANVTKSKLTDIHMLRESKTTPNFLRAVVNTDLFKLIYP